MRLLWLCTTESEYRTQLPHTSYAHFWCKHACLVCATSLAHGRRVRGAAPDNALALVTSPAPCVVFNTSRFYVRTERAKLLFLWRPQSILCDTRAVLERRRKDHASQLNIIIIIMNFIIPHATRPRARIKTKRPCGERAARALNKHHSCAHAANASSWSSDSCALAQL